MRILFALLLCAASAHAEVSHFDILSREQPALQDRLFGGAGTAEKITGRATISLDPADPHNAVIADIELAPRNAAGRVEATTDVVILRPAHPNGTMIFEVLNRGRKLLTGWADETDAIQGTRLERSADAGRGFLLSQGFTLVWAGWQADAPGNPGIKITVPTVPGLTGPSREEWSFPDAASPKRVTLSYPAAVRDTAQLTVRPRADDARAAPEGLSFSWADDSTIEITRPPGLAQDSLYELTYTARDPRVTGMGLAAMRDVTSYLRHETSPQNPLALDRPARAIAVGVSQSGRVLRDALYFGMTQDEAGRVVWEGMMPLIPGARRSFTNARFAQPGRNPGPQYDRLFPVLQFPFTYAVMEDVVSGRRDGLLARCSLSNTCPKIMQMDSEFEYWGSEGSLLVTDTRGNHIALPPNVRGYMVAGAPHLSAFDMTASRNPGCALPLNPLNAGPALRALLTAMQAWVADGVEPPGSRVPTLASGTLVTAADVYPVPIPSLGYHAQYVRGEFITPGPRLPEVHGTYPLYVPRAGIDGNAIAGLRLPIIAAPRATYTGWNPVTGAEGPQNLCTQMGGAIALAATKAEREAAGDPRPSLAERYPAPDSYVNAVREAAARLTADRLLLAEDATAAIEAARAGTLARLPP